MHGYLNADALAALMDHEKIPETETRPRVSTKKLRTKTLRNPVRNIGTGTIALSDVIVTHANGTQYVMPALIGNRKRTRTTAATEAPQKVRKTAADMPAIGDSNH